MEKRLKLTIREIIGKPGSGKSFLANQLQQQFDSIVVDDPFHFDQIHRAITVAINDPEPPCVIICDCFLCEARQRDKLIERLYKEFPEVEFDFIYYFFENNPDKCLKNVEYRNDGRKVAGSIRRFAKTYEIPDGITPIPIWEPQ